MTPAARPGRRMQIALLVVVLGEHDAVGTDVREMAAALAAAGHEASIFTTAGQDPGVPVRAVEAIEELIADPSALLIYHFAVGWPTAIDLLARARCRRVVRTHNVTPPEFFAGWSAAHEDACRAGRAEIAALAALGCELYLGASPYNVDDFVAAGVPRERTAVLPPFNRLDRLLAVPADLARLDGFRARRCNWLAVGRLAPNKGHLELFAAFASYLDHFEADAHLHLLGSADPRLERYNEALRERVAELGIAERVHFHGGVDEATLKAAYLGADVLLSMSAHEGFCVPLAEAMALGVPIVALAHGAQAWTVGGAGLVWEGFDAGVIAASVARLRHDAPLRDELRERGLERVACSFAPRVLAGELVQLVEALA